MSNSIQTEEKDPAVRPFEASVATSQNIMGKFLAAADVKSVYDAPIEHGEVVIIPTAEIISATGFGIGNGGGGDGGGSGGGGGGRVFSRPVAVIISDLDGVRVEPVVDVTKVALAFFTAIGFMAGMAMRMRGKQK